MGIHNRDIDVRTITPNYDPVAARNAPQGLFTVAGSAGGWGNAAIASMAIDWLSDALYIY